MKAIRAAARKYPTWRLSYWLRKQLKSMSSKILVISPLKVYSLGTFTSLQFNVRRLVELVFDENCTDI